MGNKQPTVLITENKFPSFSISPRCRSKKKQASKAIKRSKFNIIDLCSKITPQLLNKLAKHPNADLSVALRFLDENKDLSGIDVSQELFASLYSSKSDKTKPRKIYISGSKYKDTNDRKLSNSSSKNGLRKDYASKIPKPKRKKSSLLDLSKEKIQVDDSFISHRTQKRKENFPDVSFDTESYVDIYRKKHKKETVKPRDTPNFNYLGKTTTLQEKIFENVFKLNTEDRFSFATKQESEKTTKSSTVYNTMNGELLATDKIEDTNLESLNTSNGPATIYKKKKLANKK